MGEDYPRTIDWDDHWREREASADEREAMRESGVRFADRFDRFFADGFPKSFASVGCGLAPTVFPLAERHPRSEFHGIDAAAPVVAGNRTRAAERGVENLSFDVGRLPELAGVEREYGCVFCYATLHYVADSERALTALYDRVAPGGTLVVHYPNRNTRRAYRRSDADERFELVRAGENLLSYEAIREALGARPVSFWKAVGADDWRRLGAVEPCVSVEN